MEVDDARMAATDLHHKEADQVNLSTAFPGSRACTESPLKQARKLAMPSRGRHQRCTLHPVHLGFSRQKTFAALPDLLLSCAGGPGSC